jgi:tetratricopeptide (TPR) repeat protein
MVVAIFSQSQQAWFQNSFLKNLTTQKITFQTRLISWQSAAKDFHNHPMLGTGFGNYAVVFDKYFDSKFYNFTTSETYFDRAHNNLIDIASTGGLVSLFTYLSIFLALFYYLITEMKRNGWRAGTSDANHRKNLELIILASLVAAYFIQNLAIFDSFVTYIGLMITLGFVYFIAEQGKEGIAEPQKAPLIKTQNLEITTLIVFLIIAYSFTSIYNLRPKRMLADTIKAYSQMLSGEFMPGFKSFKEALHGDPLERDARVVLINLVGANPQLLKMLSQEEASEIVDYTVSSAEKNVSYNPQDSLMQMQLASVLDVATQFYVSFDKDKAGDYSNRTMTAIDASVAASPGRATVYLSRAQMHLIRGNNEKALEDINYAINLNPNYYEGNCRLAQLYAYLKNNENFGQALDKCIDTGGDKYLTQQEFMADSINYYIENNDLIRAAKLGKRLVELNPEDADMMFNLAKIQYALGDKVQATENISKAVKLNPEISTFWQEFIQAFAELE